MDFDEMSFILITTGTWIREYCHESLKFETTFDIQPQSATGVSVLSAMELYVTLT